MILHMYIENILGGGGAIPGVGKNLLGERGVRPPRNLFVIRLSKMGFSCSEVKFYFDTNFITVST